MLTGKAIKEYDDKEMQKKHGGFGLFKNEIYDKVHEKMYRVGVKAFKNRMEQKLD